MSIECRTKLLMCLLHDAGVGRLACITQLLNDSGKGRMFSINTEFGPELLWAALTIALDDVLDAQRRGRSVRCSGTTQFCTHTPVCPLILRPLPLLVSAVAIEYRPVLDCNWVALDDND